MPLLPPANLRPVVLVVNDLARAASSQIATLLEGAEVVECPSSDAAWSTLVAGRRYSAVVTGKVDAYLGATATRLGVPVVTLDGTAISGLEETIAALRFIPRGSWAPIADGRHRPEEGGRLVTVCGPGGTGTSTLAAGLAGLAGPVGLAGADVSAGGGTGAAITANRGGNQPGWSVILADFALHADQAYLHGLPEPAVGLLDLATLAHARPLAAPDVACHSVPMSGYRLVPGLARPCHWTAVSPPAFDEVLDGVRSACRLVVADITGEFEGESDSGSMDVEERNHMARRCAATADVVVAVGAFGPAGWRRLSGMVNDLLDHGVDPARILPVVNRADHRHLSPGAPLRRHLCGLPVPVVELASFATDARVVPLDRAVALVAPLVASVSSLLSRVRPADRTTRPLRVAPGTLGLAAR
ncbi:MAG: hypothetical protein ACRDZ8_00805 [Acidimicrobiales bacterium]